MSQRILVIDDDKLLLRRLQKSLTELGCEVLTALDGEEGLRLIQMFRPDIVISDTLMPRMDGLDLARKVKGDAQLRSIRFILMSGIYKGVTFRQDIIDSGVDAFVEKPIDIPRLIGLVKKYLALCE